ncbi:hypothetical protein GS624_03580 [Ruegeria sp. HKCCD5849]|uniref:hypothetical protein n=1 Tax=unclassified Ruegeria TaxID=2625375 RepID=UPI00149139B8|nr:MULTISPECIES: hypothetical protein [unclassified Ruegeria]NOD46385.1 hypothetical protein [Ruegeria sp. HKCCD5849]NOD50315.1 hypothetical protein [Ruegeria sp. HKCCD5851]
MKITRKTAPAAARKLIRRVPHLRQIINRLSRKEERGSKSAAEERRKITKQFEADNRAVTAAIAETRSFAADVDRAALILRTRDTHTHDSPVARLANLACRLGCHSPTLDHLATACREVSERAEGCADAAEDRVDAHTDELRSASLLMLLSDKLPTVGFDMKSPKIKAIRDEYLVASGAAAKQRKGKSHVW